MKVFQGGGRGRRGEIGQWGGGEGRGGERGGGGGSSSVSGTEREQRGGKKCGTADFSVVHKVKPATREERGL